LAPSFRRLVLRALSLGVAAVTACGSGIVHQLAGSSDAGTDAAVASPEASAPDAGPDSALADASTPPVCPSTCGPSATESCCTTLPVPGGTFYRSYDGVSCDELSGVCFNQTTWPATVSDFALDRFEVTMARYRPFAAAVEGGWHPDAGAGKHTHLNGGQGLVDVAGEAGVAYETGWDPSWNAELSSAIAEPDASGCGGDKDFFTPSPGPYDNRPIECVPWWTAYAFCIWDGGFLPSEAEWNYAASGGSQQRVYPWGSEPIDCTRANFDWCLLGDAGPSYDDYYASVAGAYSPMGDGLFGQADLEGNVLEWTLDYSSNYVTPCVDCAFLELDPAFGDQRIDRSTAYDQATPYITPVVSERGAREPQIPLSTGIRCARAP